MARRLVIFDVDETLVHATTDSLSRLPDFTVPPYGVYVRPHLNDLLEFAKQNFDLAVWSSSERQYVNEVAQLLFAEHTPLKFVWAIERCVQRPDPRTNNYVYIKDLRKVQGQGYAVENITLIDDSPEKAQRQPRNHIRVSPYGGGRDDVELLNVRVLLQQLVERPAP